MQKKTITILTLFTLLLTSCTKNEVINGTYELSAKYKTQLQASLEDPTSIYGDMFFKQDSKITFSENFTFTQKIYQKCLDFEVFDESIMPSNFYELAEEQKAKETSVEYKGTYTAKKGVLVLQPDTITFFTNDEQYTQNYAEYLTQNSQKQGPSLIAKYILTEDSLIFNPDTENEEVFSLQTN